MHSEEHTYFREYDVIRSMRKKSKISINQIYRSKEDTVYTLNLKNKSPGTALQILLYLISSIFKVTGFIYYFTFLLELR